MDVRCERCKTEYEFDDARITEAGVTVKCTTCGHVFKVKKKALVFTVPVKPDEAGSPAPIPAQAPVQREWKVRQANGNVFTFKELTTLQKWIVERKVTRDDEISLTGESWKRLGNIAELASFFQVVDEAQKASQLQALQSQAALGLTPPATSGLHPSMPRIPGAPEAGMVYTPPQGYPVMTTPQHSPISPVPVAPVPVPVMQPPSSVAPQQVAPPMVVPQPPPAPAMRARSVGSETLRDPAIAQLDDEQMISSFKRSGGAGKWILLLLLLAAGGGGGYWYYTYQYLPAREAAEMRQRELEAQKERERKEREEAESRAKEEERRKREEAEKAAMLAAAKADAGAGPTDAGTTAKAPDKGQKPEPVRDFDYWMARGDRLREAEKPQAALDAYGMAADLEPDRAEPHAGRGMALLDMGMPQQAEAAFHSSLELNGRYGVALIGLAETYRALGKKEEAIRYYEKYLEVLPNGPEASVARNAIDRLRQ